MGSNIIFFRTKHNTYIYDGITGDILPTDSLTQTILTHFWGSSSEEIIEGLKDKYSIEAIKSAIESIRNTMEMGLLSEIPRKIYLDAIMQETDYDLENNKGMIILSVTQNCNLRCEYCAYSGIYEGGRVHSDKNMSFETARKAIDHGISKASAKKEIVIGFYGGEPLLRFDLIKQCIEYVKSEYEGKKVNFNITTNGTLLKDEYVSYLVENEATIYISLDGPEEYQDEYRKFAGTGKGTFNVVEENILNIKRKYPEYYALHVCYGITVSPYRSIEKLEDFIWGADYIAQSNYARVSTVSQGESLELYSEKKNEENQKNIAIEQGFIDLRYMHAKIHNNRRYIDRSKVPASFNDGVERMHTNRMKKAASDIMLPSGTCIPAGEKMYVSTDGEYFICEKCDEMADVLKLGNIEQGVDKEKSKKILRDYFAITEEECPKCWANLYCSICPIQVEDKNELSRQKKLQRCNDVKHNLKKDLIKFMTIMERNPYAFD